MFPNQTKDARIDNGSASGGWTCCDEVAARKDVDELRRHIHEHRLGTDATQDRCWSCDDMARRRLGLPTLPRPRKEIHRSPAGIYLTDVEEVEHG
jgi:hypothetical protein